MFAIVEKCLIIWSFIILLRVESTLLESPSSCGVKQVRKAERIVHGYDTKPGDWPWHAAIFHRKRRNSSYACGGTLISEQFVVTAAHCVLGENGHQLSDSRIFVQLGVHNLDVLNTERVQQHDVEKIYQPKSNKSENLKDDIALLKLATITRFTDYVQPACVSTTREHAGQFGTVVGWGVTEDDETSAVLKSTQMPAIDPVECLASNRDLFGPTLDVGMFCAGYTNGTSVCNGDSGGGLFFNNGNVWYLGGIVSFSDGRNDSATLCNTGGYAVFTKLFAYLPWISSITKLQFLVEDTTLDHCKQNDAGKDGYHSNLLPGNCGVYNTSLVSKGQKSNVFEFPWMASLRYGNRYKMENLEHICAGTLINKRYVLTSATCLVHVIPEKVILGEHTMGQEKDCNELNGEKQCAPPVREYGIESTIPHQNFSIDTEANDIGLIRLDGDVPFEDHIKPICLPVSSSLRALRPLSYITTGWGRAGFNRNNTQTLLKATATPTSEPTCQEWMKTQYYTKMHDSQICVDGTNDVCNGEYGGPLGHPTNCNGMRFVQFGVASKPKCGNDDPSVYTDVSSVMDWVIANVKP